jgi:catechol 2,3-dioxygenase-like lactoylglutathione lyase family enzyme
MLANEPASATVAVKDLARAKKFYEETLGLTPVETQGEEAILFKSGSSTITVYRSQYAGTNAATALTWNVNDVDAAVRELRGKGVRFEHYDMPDMKVEGDVHVAGDLRAAWFKDPDGNILAVVSGCQTARERISAARSGPGCPAANRRRS